MKTKFFPLEGWDATRETLHAYSRVVGVVPRALAPQHPKWWHISLKVTPLGLMTDNIPLPGGGAVNLRMDFARHEIVLAGHRGEVDAWAMTEGASADQMAERIFSALSALGLDGSYKEEKYASADPREYETSQVEAYWNSLVNIEHIFRRHWNSLSGELGPIQVWPHGFDIAFEWFGSRQVEYEEGERVKKLPAQLNLGWSPGEPGHPRPYFYSNPWPFEADRLTGHNLPSGAAWHRNGWEGSLLEYDPLVDDPDAGSKVLEYAAEVFRLAAPTLTA